MRKVADNTNIVYDLYPCEVDGRKSIYCHFDNQDVDFFRIASTGTRSLALFYYWYIRMQESSFVFIDEFDTDIIEVLREEHEELKEQLEGINRDDFSEVYLFFDYDGHQNNLSEDDDSDVLEQMLKSFDNETENGKLYISYPMVEALRDFEEGKCGITADIRCHIHPLQFRKRQNSKRIRSKKTSWTNCNLL